MTDLDKELIEFVKKYDEEVKNGERKILRDDLTAELLRQVIKGDRIITAMATSADGRDAFVCFSWPEELQEGKENSDGQDKD